jgi:membrane carboxypeptidase/penicillin-binding protein
VAAEDRRFFEHYAVDERGIIRAFIGNLGDPGRPQGGSTITQQVVKNLLVGDDVTYERKIREMIVASRVESTLSKQEILELDRAVEHRQKAVTRIVDSFPWCSLILGSMSLRRCRITRAYVPSSSSCIRRLYPEISAARIAASRRTGPSGGGEPSLPPRIE